MIYSSFFLFFFCCSNLRRETGGFELAWTITLVLQANRLTMCASHPLHVVILNQIQGLEGVIPATISRYANGNLNSMTARTFEKINLLEAYNTINKVDVICLSEYYLDLSIASDNDDLNIKGYNLYRADKINVKRGGVCAYIRESLPVRCLSNAYLQKYLILEISINNKNGYVVSLYRSPSQTLDEFDSFINNFENNNSCL